MSSCKIKYTCKDFGKDVIVTVYYKHFDLRSGSGAVPTGVVCSGSPNGRCGKCDICPVLKEAENRVHYGNF